jgi:hypothetical protein
MATLTRDRVEYSVGSVSNPGDSIGRSELVIEVDGRATLVHETRAGSSAWTGTVSASGLDRFWSALDEAAFPDMPKHPVPPGSAIRALTIGVGEDKKAAHVAYHASRSLRGYGEAFSILDAVVFQMRKGGEVSSTPPLVEGVRSRG